VPKTNIGEIGEGVIYISKKILKDIQNEIQPLGTLLL